MNVGSFMSGENFNAAKLIFFQHNTLIFIADFLAILDFFGYIADIRYFCNKNLQYGKK